MAISNEEQLLNELLRALRDGDERLDASDLEARVVAAWETTPSPRQVNGYYVSSVAAAAMIAVFLFMLRATAVDSLPVVRPPELRTAAASQPIDFPLEVSVTKSPIRQKPIAQSSILQSPIEFLPLVPLSEHELTGAFQIVRVQMPRASLGALTSPFEHPSEFVEADVLLGEDGMARAIRISTNESGYPWRSR